MKKIIFKIVSLLNTIWLAQIKGYNVSGTFVNANIIKGEKNTADIIESELINSKILMSGFQNSLVCSQALISDSLIKITGDNNKLVIGKDVKLRNANITLRGESCTVIIGDRTTFGGIRIINVGGSNLITIGKDCLFSDNIEIWASDTHAIYDNSGHWVNKERPVSIGDGVWVGSGVTILKGTDIGNGSVIGIRSLVNKDVPSHTICAGTPCRVIKEGVTWKLEYPINK